MKSADVFHRVKHILVEVPDSATGIANARERADAVGFTFGGQPAIYRGFHRLGVKGEVAARIILDSAGIGGLHPPLVVSKRSEKPHYDALLRDGTPVQVKTLATNSLETVNYNEHQYAKDVSRATESTLVVAVSVVDARASIVGVSSMKELARKVALASVPLRDPIGPRSEKFYPIPLSLFEEYGFTTSTMTRSEKTRTPLVTSVESVPLGACS